MATTTATLTTGAIAATSAAISIADKDLSRLLSRLDAKLASNPPATAVERAKLTANLEYARQLLHKLEADVAAVPVARRAKTLPTELGEQKRVIRRLNEGLQQLGEEEEEDDEEGGDEEAGEDDAEGRPATETDAAAEDDDDYARLEKKTRPPPPPAASATTQLPSTTSTAPAPSATIRNRFPAKSNDQRAELFGRTTGRDTGDVASSEAVLDVQREEQENITADLLNMAKMLKESSLAFGQNLEDEKVYLDQAKEGLDRNAAGMQTAGLKMENLRKDESVGFLWSWIYLGIIAVLWFFTLFILFFAPKLRWW